MKTTTLGSALYCTAAAALLSYASASSHAAPVTDYLTYRGTAATVLSGQGTDDPIVGAIGTTANSSFVLGFLDEPATLGPNVGDKITFTFDVEFNDETGTANAGDNFRFALFDTNGETRDSATGGALGGPDYATAGTDNTDNFRGYWFGARNGSGTGSGGSIRERIAMLVAGDNSFAATGDNNVTAPSLGPVGGDPVVLASSVNGDETGPTYSGELTLTRNASNLIDLSGSFIGTNNATGNVYAASDMTAETLPTSFEAIGFLIGNALNTDQAIFTDIDVSVIPAASAENADFDGDGDVDGEDFLTLQQNNGIDDGSANLEQGDANDDGDVDGLDVAIFREQFGEVDEVGAVPEPASLALAGLACVAAAMVRRRRS